MSARIISIHYCRSVSFYHLSTIYMWLLVFAVLNRSFANILLKREKKMIKEEIESYSNECFTSEKKAELRWLLLSGNRFYCKWVRKKQNKSTYNVLDQQQAYCVAVILLRSMVQRKRKKKRRKKNLFSFLYGCPVQPTMNFMLFFSRSYSTL